MPDLPADVPGGREFWPIEGQFDVGDIVFRTQALLKVAPDVPIMVDPGKITWFNMGVLIAQLRLLTKKIHAEADALERKCFLPYQGTKGAAILALTGQPPTGCLWRASDHDRFFKELRDWEDRLRGYEELWNQFGAADPNANAWEAIGERLMSGIFRYTDDKGEGKVLDTYPDFVTPFMVANQLSIQRQIMEEWAETWFFDLVNDFADAAGKVLEKGAEVVGGAAGAAVGAYEKAKGKGGFIIFAAGAAAVLLLTRKK